MKQTWFRYGWAGAVFEADCSLMSIEREGEPRELVVGGAVQNTYFQIRWKRTAEEAMSELMKFHEVYTKPCRTGNCPVCSGVKLFAAKDEELHGNQRTSKSCGSISSIR